MKYYDARNIMPGMVFQAQENILCLRSQPDLNKPWEYVYIRPDDLIYCVDKEVKEGTVVLKFLVGKGLKVGFISYWKNIPTDLLELKLIDNLLLP